MSDNKNKNDEMKKLNANEIDNVSGGIFWQDDNYDDGLEKSCILSYHSKNECDKSSDGYHYHEAYGAVGQTRCTRCGKIFGGHDD